MRLEIQTSIKKTESDAKHLEVMLEAMIKPVENTVQRPTFQTFEQFCYERQPWGLGYAPAAIRTLIEERKTAQAYAELPQPEIVNGGETVPRVSVFRTPMSRYCLCQRDVRNSSEFEP